MAGRIGSYWPPSGRSHSCLARSRSVAGLDPDSGCTWTANVHYNKAERGHPTPWLGCSPAFNHSIPSLSSLILVCGIFTQSHQSAPFSLTPYQPPSHTSCSRNVMKLLTAVTLAASVIGATAFENCVTKEAGGEVFFLCDKPRDAVGIGVKKELDAIGFKGYQWRQEDTGVADVVSDLKKRDPRNASPALEGRDTQRRSWWPSLPKVAYMYYKTPAKAPVQEEVKPDSDAEKKAPAAVAVEKERRSKWPFIPKTEYMYYKTPASAPVKAGVKADSDAEKKPPAPVAVEKERRSWWPFQPNSYMNYEQPPSAPVEEDNGLDSDAEKRAPVAVEKEKRSKWPFIPKTEYMYYKTPASAPAKEDVKADSDAEKKAPAPVAAKKEKRSRWPFIPKTEYMYYKTPTSQEGDKPDSDAQKKAPAPVAAKKEKRSRWPFIPKTEYMYYKTPTSQEGDKPASDA
ncbi:hypothetical protein NLU13_1463 [Sarocladium strictum]|uniref:Uncharacterized protein n=1 Tax=Sarocladium strictum TaxID=5046 RepID=A0AA39GR17_SARSR|nr:hypothetical protein NLU13_1463 [Sarocladium strictum]